MNILVIFCISFILTILSIIISLRRSKKNITKLKLSSMELIQKCKKIYLDFLISFSNKDWNKVQTIY